MALLAPCGLDHRSATRGDLAAPL